jgi:autotransporter-associated beta strand protein
MSRIAQTDEEIGIITGGGSSGAIDFSATGANLPNAFLAGGWATNNAKNDGFTGTIIPANNTYRIGFTGANGSFGMSSLLDGASNGLLIGGNNVVLTNANTFGGETQIRTGAALLLANTLAIQNSALNVGVAGGTIAGSFGLSRYGQANFVNDKLVTSATIGGLIGSRDLATAYNATTTNLYGNNAQALAANAVRGFTLNPGTGKYHIYTGVIANFTRDTIITKTGAGSQEFGSNNSYSGVTTISDGVLSISNANALGRGGSAGTSAGSTIVNSGGTLDLNGTSNVVEPIVLNGTGFGGNGALINNSATAASIVGGIASLQITNGGTYTTAPTVSLSGAGTGATATVQLGVTNASISISAGGAGFFVGDLFSTSGGGGSGAVYEVTSIGAGGSITGVNLVNGGSGYTSAPTGITRLTRTNFTVTAPTVTFNATNFAVAGLTMTNFGSGYDDTTTASFSAGGATAAVQHSSVVLASNSSIGGSGDITIGAVVSETGGARDLTKIGSGVLTLTAANTYTGATNVDQGTLVLNGSTAAASAVNVASGATLGGNGIVGGTLNVTGRIAPGNSDISTLFAGATTWNGAAAADSTTDWTFELGTGDTADLLEITGDFSKDTTIGSVFRFDFLGSAFAGTFDLVIWDGTTDFDVSDFSYTNLGGGYTGSFNITGSTLQFVSVIPEPSTALAGILLGLGLLRRRRQG